MCLIFNIRLVAKWGLCSMAYMRMSVHLHMCVCIDADRRELWAIKNHSWAL